MPKLKLTKSGVEKLPYFMPSPDPSKKNQELYWDTELAGFGLRVTGASKTYIVEKRVNRRTVRARIGRHNQIPTDKARRLAQKLIYEMTSGQDVNARKKAIEGESITLQQAFDEFLERRSLKERTIWDYRRAMDIPFKNWKRKRVIDITRTMVSRHHRKLGDEIGKAQANQSMRFLRSLINFSAGQYEDGDGKPLIKDNPVSVITQTKTWYRIERRRTIIKNHELASWFGAVEALNGDLVKDYLKVLLFTGLRKQEAMKLCWDQIDLKAKTLTVIDTKNRNPLTLPLGPFILKLLKARKSIATDSPFVFPGTGKTGHLVESKHQTAQVTKESGIQFCLHDLRRVFINAAEGLDISSYAVKQLVNHSTNGDVTAGYMVSDPERLRKPMERIETHLLRLCRNDTAKVINIK
jgi:integrase|tara:strand:- start:1764 stop:2990 length:1227 start_codon:yes stop_codon:yes gene_type:complete